MKIKQTIWKVAASIGVCLLLLTMISFVGKKEVVGYKLSDIEVNIENTFENFFIDEEDVMSLIMTSEGDSILGDDMGRVNLKEIESRIEKHSFVKDAQVFRDLRGHLVVKAIQNKPIARIVAANGANAYLGQDGDILPVSPKYTARVVILSGKYMNEMTKRESIKDIEYDQQIFDLVNYINEDKFWSKQIAQIDVDRSGEITMIPQVGGQMLEFGYASDFKSKFMRLDIFFKQILPNKGWNTYDRVSVVFKNQIICE